MLLFTLTVDDTALCCTLVVLQGRDMVGVLKEELKDPPEGGDHPKGADRDDPEPIEE